MQINSCPGCQGNEYSFSGLIGSSIDTIVKDEIFHQPEYRIKLCNNCGLYYKSNIAEETTLNRYYEKTDPLKWDHNSVFPTEKAIIKVLLKLAKGSKILDFGCGAGSLLSYLTKQYDCYGIEINEIAAKVAISRGVKIMNDDELKSISRMFDAIVLCDVFEHLTNPTETLKYLKRFLKKDGIILISTGNGDAKACKNDIANFWYLRTIEHVCMFTKKYAKFLESELDFDMLSWSTMCHYDLGIVDKFSQYAKNYSYWQFNNKDNIFTKSLLRLIPFLRRAEKWASPPPFVASEDHVLCVFKIKK